MPLLNRTLFARISIIILASVVGVFTPSLLLADTGHPFKQAQVTVGILLFDEAEIIDFSAPYEVFGAAGYDVVTLSKDGRQITTAMGMKVQPSHSLAEAPKLDLLLVPGGNVGKVMHDKDIHQWINAIAPSTQQILSVCTGSHILAEVGLLDGKSATTFHGELAHLRKQYPKITVKPELRWVRSGKVVTSAGLSSGIDAAIHLVETFSGLAKALSVAALLEYDWRPDGGYVRAMQADRYYPIPLGELKRATGNTAIYNYGDEHSWIISHLSDEQDRVRELHRYFVEHMRQKVEWRLLSKTNDTYRWVKLGTDQITFTLDLATDASVNIASISASIQHMPRSF